MSHGVENRRTAAGVELTRAIGSPGRALALATVSFSLSFATWGLIGGLGGFVPPLLLGLFRDRLGVIWPWFVLPAATALLSNDGQLYSPSEHQTLDASSAVRRWNRLRVQPAATADERHDVTPSSGGSPSQKA